MRTSTQESISPKLSDARRFQAARLFLRRRTAVLGALILVALVVLAVGAPVFSAQDPENMDLSRVLKPPSPQFPLGTDYLGRDILTRLLYGGRLSLLIGLLAVVLGLAIGVPLGAVSGYYGGWADLVIQRFADTLLAFPGFLLSLSLVAVLGVGLQNVIFSVAIGALPSFIRLVRGSVLAIREQTYVEAARSTGAGDWLILIRHVLPNATAPIIVQATLNLGSAILIAAGLGFLGLGVKPGTPEWGTMMGEGRQFIFAAWYMATFPGLAIFLAVMGFNLLGDGLRDMLDPRLKNL